MSTLAVYIKGRRNGLKFDVPIDHVDDDIEEAILLAQAQMQKDIVDEAYVVDTSNGQIIWPEGKE